MTHLCSALICKLNARDAKGSLWIKLAIVAVVGLGQPVFAQGLGEMVLSAQTTRTVDVTAVIEVRVSDDTELNIRLKDAIKELLTSAGFKIDGISPSITLQLQTRRLIMDGGDGGTIAQFHVGSTTGRPSGSLNDPRGSEVDLNVKLWSSTKKSLLGRNNPTKRRQRGFELILEAYDVINGAYVWRGSARAPDTGGDIFGMGQSMARRLVDVYGKTVAPQIVEIF
jgi:hypothetical protein